MLLQFSFRKIYFKNKNNLSFNHNIYSININQSNILNNPVPDIALIPTPYKRFLPSLKTIADKASAKIKKRVNEFADWLMNCIPPRTKAIVSNSIQKILNLFLKVKLFKTALKDFTKSYE